MLHDRRLTGRQQERDVHFRRRRARVLNQVEQAEVAVRRAFREIPGRGRARQRAAFGVAAVAGVVPGHRAVDHHLLVRFHQRRERDRAHVRQRLRRRSSRGCAPPPPGSSAPPRRSIVWKRHSTSASRSARIRDRQTRVEERARRAFREIRDHEPARMRAASDIPAGWSCRRRPDLRWGRQDRPACRRADPGRTAVPSRCRGRRRPRHPSDRLQRRRVRHRVGGVVRRLKSGVVDVSVAVFVKRRARADAGSPWRRS